MTAPTNPNLQRFGVLGSGAWGTALAQTSARAGRMVTLWARESAVASTIATTRSNPDYLPGVMLEPSIQTTTDLSAAVAADAILVVCPAQHVRSVLDRARAHWPSDCPAILCAKGLERETGALLSEVVADCLPGRPVAVLSGPTFAIEVARGLPTAVTLATERSAMAQDLALALGTKSFRPYPSTDIVGAEVGGAVKNVLAIACGIVEGLGLGDNARAALLTRGLAELARFSSGLGGRPDTVAGLSGLGDLALTAASMQSRNFALGHALGQGQALESLMRGRKTVAEGVFSASAVQLRAKTVGVEMPICAAVHAIVEGTLSVTEAVEALLSRPLRSETE